MLLSLWCRWDDGGFILLCLTSFLPGFAAWSCYREESKHQCSVEAPEFFAYLLLSWQISFATAMLALRKNCFPGCVFLWGCHHSSPVMGWWQPGLAELFSNNSTIFFFFFLIGGAVEDSGEAGVLLWVSGGVQCLHHSPGVSGPSPSLRWCRGRTPPPHLWDILWAPGSGCLCVCFQQSPTINILERGVFFPLKT